MILDILTYPDPRLKTVSHPVAEITDEVRALAQDMFDTMYASRGVGLAAPQVGRFLRMLVMHPVSVEGEAVYPPMVLINPVVTPLGEDVVSPQEGCLSVPLNYRSDVMRKSRVMLSALDLDGNSIAEEFVDYPAIVLQHEADHLDGVLFIDQISRLRRSLYDAKVKKWQTRRNSE
ncbi:MAG: peptide deformylase [Desulfovibrio sp.]|jgi:peptide deformylase|nr:peptide deformylase [Desulfovibrio sp.]